MHTPFESVQRATNSLLQTVDGITDSAWREPSVLPAWSRAHVVAHLALNAEGQAAALDSLRTERALPMYASDEARDADIETLASGSGDTLRERLFASTTLWAEALSGLDPDRASMLIERVPGGRAFPAEDVVTLRWREVEIHHADLDLGFTPEDWSPAFVDVFFAHILAQRAGEISVVLRHPGGEEVLGGGGPVVTGSRADLAYWLAGRPARGLSGELPALGPWPAPAPRVP